MTPIAQNVVWALPSGRPCRVFSSAAIEASIDGTTFAALTGANAHPGVDTSAVFIRCPGGAANVIVK